MSIKEKGGQRGRLGLGIDTGGTFTDAAVVEMSSKRVLVKVKSLTTYQDLSLGLHHAVSSVMEHDIDPGHIGLVGVSTTLATNSILEGKGGSVGLIGIGWRPKEGWYLGEDLSVFVQGGHEVTGLEREPLDMKEVEAALEGMLDKVDALVVSGLFSVYNHNHESKVRRFIRERTGLPVVCGHELTGELGIQERTVTAVLNARLIPILDTFLEDVEIALSNNGIEAPIMVFKGDGSLMNIDTAKDRPVETILSGPAASSMGGRILTGLEDCVVIDMGGTSTDIAFLDRGFPRIVPEGASIGRWRTRVRAVDIWTSALGGDSEIVVDRWGNLELKPDRVVPLSIAAGIDDDLLNKIRETGQLRFLMAHERDATALDGKERLLLDYLMTNGPSTRDHIMENVDIVLLERFIKRLRDKNLIIGIGLTPTDVMRLAGHTEKGSLEAAELGVDLSRKSMGLPREEFIEHVQNLMVSRLSEEVLRKIVLDDGGIMPDGGSSSYLLENASGWRESELLDLRPMVRKRIVGIGAPAHVYIPSMEGRLGTEILIPENHEVGNAVGAVCSPIVETANAIIFPENGKYHLYSSFSVPAIYSHLEQATGAARSMVESEVKKRAERSGAVNINVKVAVDVSKSVCGELVEGEIISRIDVRARAVGQPSILG
jgi:N-methylhydantoinase A/oxoprolinase/acetone carboxylase beta subunit